jgi:homoserine O-succinyltransferase
MTVVLPKDYHAKNALEDRQIICVSHEDALREDIRALRIGILNIMPQADTYEFNLLHPLGISVLQIEPIFIRLQTHQYKSTSPEHLEKLYVPFKTAVDKLRLDGLIITGAPVEEIPFEEISYWNEIQRILRYARANVPSTLGLCWGALAIAKFLGIDKVMFEKKLFGVYEIKNLDTSHRITGGMDDYFWCPQSRHSGVADAVMEAERDKGALNLLGYGREGGYTIFESSDHRFLIHLGHPEYEAERLVFEYTRDKQLGRGDVEAPANIDLGNPANRWRGHRNQFFAQWIRYIHETTTY